jgi:hypothetical protein
MSTAQGDRTSETEDLMSAASDQINAEDVSDRSFLQVRRLIVLLAVIVSVAAVPSLANAAGSYRSSGFNCLTSPYLGRTVRAIPPYPMTNWSGTGTLEYVYWSADLYKWNGSSWQLFDGTTPWLLGTANQYDVIPVNGYKWYVGNQAYWYLQFSGLPSGYYAVKESFAWQNGYQLSQWSSVQGTTSQYCGL